MTATTTIDRRVFLGTAFTGALATGLVAATARPAWACSSRARKDTNAFEWNELASARVWATGGNSTGGNAMVVASEGKALMVDSKFAGLGPLLRQEAEQHAGCAVSTFINTHHHGDHTGGNLAFSDGTEMLAHAAAARRIAESGDGYQRQVEGAQDAAKRLGSEENATAATLAWSAASARATGIAAWMPTRTVNAYPMRLAIGKLGVEVYHFGPGHTDSDLVIHVPDLNVMHCGDLFFNGRHPFFDPTGGVSAAGWARSLRLALELCDGSTKIIPGHGPVGDRAALTKQLDYMEHIVEEVGKAGRAGKSRDEVAAMSWPFMDGLGAENVKGRAIAAVYDELFPSP